MFDLLSKTVFTYTDDNGTIDVIVNRPRKQPTARPTQKQGPSNNEIAGLLRKLADRLERAE